MIMVDEALVDREELEQLDDLKRRAKCIADDINLRGRGHLSILDVGKLLRELTE